MACPVNQDYLQMHIDDQLDTLERIVLDEHLSTCKSCMRALNQLKVLDWDLKRLPMPELPEELEILREKAISQFVAPQKNGEAEEKKILNSSYLKLQYNNLSHTVKFASYLPGSKLFNKFTARGYKIAAKKSKEQVSHLLKKIIGI
jgi:hypothetical protein